jgi:hypothetical protein
MSESKPSKPSEMPSSLPINEDLTKLVATLNSHEVEFLIAGAHALAYYGQPRFTEDIDFFINKTKENVLRLANALQESGITLDSEGQTAFLTDPRGMIVIGREPNRADLLNFLSGLTFTSAWENRAQGQIANETVFFLSKEDYIKTKQAAGRPKDIADLTLLAEADPSLDL